MSRRGVAGVVAVALFLGFAALVNKPAKDYVKYSPGPTVDILGKYDGKKILEISGHKTYADTGALRLLTVYVTRPENEMSLAEVVQAWADDDVALVPWDAQYDKGESDEASRAQSAQQMTSSQDAATAAALRAAGIRFAIHPTVNGVDETGPSRGVLKDRDRILAVDGRAVRTAQQVIDAISALEPGDRVTLQVQRGTRTLDRTITTAARPEDKSKARIGVGVAEVPDFPFTVRINLGDDIGGPSAGMMFALSIYDLLTPGSLTGGKTIAGTGEIDAQGVVGPIGGIGQKMVAAQRDGAKLFLMSEENCAEAARAHYDPDKMTLVKVRTLDDAIREVDAWRQDPSSAKLTRCTR